MKIQSNGTDLTHAHELLFVFPTTTVIDLGSRDGGQHCEEGDTVSLAQSPTMWILCKFCS